MATPKNVSFIVGIVFLLIALGIVGASALDVVDYFSKVISTGSMAGALGALVEARRAREEASQREKLLNERVQLCIMYIFGENAEKLTLPISVRRGDLTRAELFGVLGACYGPTRFDAASLVTPLLINGRLAEAQAGETSELYFDTNDKEIFEAFKLNAEKLENMKPAS